MAYDEELAGRVLLETSSLPGISSRTMFGGFAVMLNGNMLCGVVGDDLMVRVGPEQGPVLLEESDARPMEFTGRPMKGMITVAGSSVTDDQRLRQWLGWAQRFVAGLPAK